MKKSMKPIPPKLVRAVDVFPQVVRKVEQDLEKENGLVMSVVALTTAISTRLRTFLRSGMSVSREESPVFRRGEDVNSWTKGS